MSSLFSKNPLTSKKSLTKQDLRFEFPADLIATKPQYPPRVMSVPPPDHSDMSPQEISFQKLLESIPKDDVLVVNNTKVLPRKIEFNGLEILFLESTDQLHWTVLMPSQKLKIGDEILLPGEVRLTLKEKGLPQKVMASSPLSDEYFEAYGSLALPPYILKQRQLAKITQKQLSHGDQIDLDKETYLDKEWYQPIWQQYFKYEESLKKSSAANPSGSLASPTASLHFKPQDFEKLKAQGVKIVPITLHVGLGTFLPIKTDELAQHTMHFEWVEIPRASYELIQKAKAEGAKVWALGTTVARSLESIPLGILEAGEGPLAYQGMTNLFIQPGFEWKVVDRLLTNFHQPESTLLALVASIAGLEKTLAAYRWAVEKRFRLFSYGDFSLWMIN
jgi:S-adenosylmethionine:tRNA ribosyltransferase-isomerase